MASLRAAVTGAGGFLGGHLVERLCREGARVDALVHGAPARTRLSRASGAAEARVVVGDVTDLAQMRRFVEGADVVFHLAARSSAVSRAGDGVAVVRGAVDGARGILEAAASGGVGRVVVASSSHVYRPGADLTEDHPLEVRSPYGAGKLAVERLCKAWSHSHGLQPVILRLFGTYGPRQAVRHVVPVVIAQLLDGDAVELGNLRPVRDFNYVADAVDAMVLAGRVPQAVGGVFNIAGARRLSVGELVQVVGARMGRSPQIAVDPERVRPGAQDADVLTADCGRAERILGWTPETPLDAGLEAAIRWYRAERVLGHG